MIVKIKKQKTQKMCQIKLKFENYKNSLQVTKLDNRIKCLERK